MNIYIPFTYLIGWTEQNKYYYGVRFAQKCAPSDLWTKYFTSSKAVKSFRDQYGEPDVIQVRKCFYDKDAAIEWEAKTLKRISNRSVFLNKTFGILHGYTHEWTPEQKLKLSHAQKTSQACIDNRKRMAEINTGRIVSDETRLKSSVASLGKPKTKEHCEAISKGKKGKPGKKKSYEERQAQSIRMKGRSSSRKGVKLSTESKNDLKKKFENRHLPKVCRISDRRIMYVSHFIASINNKPKIVSAETREKIRQIQLARYNPRCCRISDRKEMPVRQFNTTETKRLKHVSLSTS